MRWKRKLGSRLSPEIDAILWPSSEKKVIDDWFNGPSVSAAIGLNRWPVCAKRLYLAVFWPAACSAAAPPNFIIYYILLYFIYSLSIIFYLFDQLNVILDHRAEQLFYWRFVCSFTYLTTNYHKTFHSSVYTCDCCVCCCLQSEESLTTVARYCFPDAASWRPVTIYNAWVVTDQAVNAVCVFWSFSPLESKACVFMSRVAC